MDKLFDFDVQRFADHPNTGDDGGQQSGDGGQGQAGETTPTEGGKTFTQADLDAILQKRLARERKAWEQQIEEERKKAQMDEAERMKAEKEEAERKAREAEERANRRAIRAEAKAQAAALGVKPERLAYVLRLADLSDVDVDENGEPDASAIKAAVEKVLQDLPELKAGAGGGGPSGAEFNGSANAVEKNPWSKDHFNLTEQGRIMRENPQLAARLRSESKGK